MVTCEVLPSANTFEGNPIIGISGLLAHYCLTTALTLIPAAVVSPLEFVRLPIIALLGFLLYSEPIELTLIIGALLIFISNYANIISEARSSELDR